MDSFSAFEHIQIEEVCRICLTKKDQMNLICETGLPDMLIECASIEVTPENGFFNLVCNDCENEVSRWYVFKQQVLRSFEIAKWLVDKKQCPDDLFAMEGEQDIIPVQFFEIPGPTNVETSSFYSHNDSLDTPEDLEDISNPATDISTTTTIAEPEETDNKSFKCAVCDKVCASTNAFNKHAKIHEDYRPFPCPTCGRLFKTSHVLDMHIKRHNNDRRFCCDLCPMKFYSRANLNIHVRTHTGEKPFECKHCNKRYTSNAILGHHILKAHENNRPVVAKPLFPCSLCDKKFHSKQALQRHSNFIHPKGATDFVCSICQQACSSKIHLDMHMQKNHAQTQCPDCGKETGSPEQLKIHMRIHTGERPFPCDICKKGFMSNANLLVHLQRHKDGKPFQCKQCNKSFVSKPNLKTHERIHTGDLPFKCSVCDKHFNQSRALRLHMRTHPHNNST